MAKIRTVLQLFIVWLLTFILVCVFIIPNTQPYENASQKYEKIAQSKLDGYPAFSKPFRTGFILGYLVYTNPFYLILVFTLQTLLIVVGTLYVKKYLIQNKRVSLFPLPMESLKNIVSNIFLFTFGIFLHRASEQLKYYITLPIKSRITALIAYALIFLSVFFIFNIENNHLFSRLVIISYIHLSVSLFLIALVFFFKPFRKNFHKRLFWISLSVAFLSWVASSYAGIEIANYQLANPDEEIVAFFPVDSRAILFALFVVLAFSFYFEVIKGVFIKKIGMESEIALAKQIQNDIVPPLESDTASYQLYGRINAASEVGGDYCDAIVLSENRFIIAVGDVSGHNVGAGVLMSMLKSAFHTELRYLADFSALHASLNETIFKNTYKNMFISFLSALVDTGNKSITFVNCGHHPLLHYSKHSNRVLEYRTGDLALGLRSSVNYRQKTLSFRSGDIFIFLSDGLVETVNSEGEEFSIDSVKNILLKHATETPWDIYHHLIRAVETFRKNLTQKDDITILVVKMLP
ncbi:SpoIIE family protein phosphatase [candidate division KSB1 bacterium]|nr:SpoIIE family protein phosphatase [candidate division KSB1 bacterium]